MPDCECLVKCPFFNDKMAHMDAKADEIKQRFCKSDFEICARYIVYKQFGWESVPPDLYPLQKSIAERIVADGGL